MNRAPGTVTLDLLQICRRVHGSSDQGSCLDYSMLSICNSKLMDEAVLIRRVGISNRQILQTNNYPPWMPTPVPAQHAIIFTVTDQLHLSGSPRLPRRQKPLLQSRPFPNSCSSLCARLIFIRIVPREIRVGINS